MQRLTFWPIICLNLTTFLANIGDATAQDGATDPTARALGPLIELEVPDDSSLDATSLVDFDHGKLLALPADLLQTGDLAAFKKWLATNGVDALGEGDNDGVIGVDIIARRIDGPIAQAFPDIPIADTTTFLEQMVTIGDPGTPVAMDAGRGVGPRATYLFRTREGAEGVLQIGGWDPASGAVGIRYRLVLSSAAAAPPSAKSEEPAPTGDAARELEGFGPVEARTLHAISASPPMICKLDFDDGKTYPNVPLKTPTSPGVDVYPKPSNLFHILKGKDVSVVRVPATVWYDGDAARRGLELLAPTHARDYVDMPSNPADMPPATYLFKTQQGGLGMFRIVKANHDEQTVELEYRLRR